MSNQPLSRMQEECLERMRRVTKTLLGVLYQDRPPEMIVAMMTLSVFEAAIGYAPANLVSEMGQWMVKQVRTRAGYCQHCDTELSPAVTHAPVCERCDARMDAQIKKALGEDEDDA